MTSQNINTALNKWFCVLLLHCWFWPLHMYDQNHMNITDIVDRKWVWTENAPSYILLVCQRCGRGRETKLAANRKVKSRRQVAEKSFSSSSKLEQPLFLFCLSFWFFEDEIEQKQQTGLKQQVNVINKAILRPSRPRMGSRIKFARGTFWAKKQFPNSRGAGYWWLTLCIVATAAFF